jgi:hypothetical protein
MKTLLILRVSRKRFLKENSRRLKEEIKIERLVLGNFYKNELRSVPSS